MLYISTERIDVYSRFSVMIGSGLHLTGGQIRKEKEKFFGHGHIAFSEHGGKTGMAMLKYPHIKKNAHAQISHRIPASAPCQTG